jgi:uracil-DNA glycosylase
LFLVGQAPGRREPAARMMFAWMAGKRLFSWFDSIGIPEVVIRTRAYLTAVTKCYPGKGKNGKGDRRPSPGEVANCAPYLDEALRLVRPRLVVPIGSLAVERILGRMSLSDAVGRTFERELPGGKARVIPLPHPSGASTWFVHAGNKGKLAKALALIGKATKVAGL